MTKIEWTNRTWNPIIGCSKCSPGCDNCYAEKMAKRIVLMNRNNETRDNYLSALNQYLNWNNHAVFCRNIINKPFRWKKPSMIFVCSMGDLFHESVPFGSIRTVFNVIYDNPHHTFQILTKRPERMAEFFNWLYQPVTFPNLWLGVTAENQEQADKRIPILLQIPAAIRFVSVEPMLGPVDVMKYLVAPAGGTPEETEIYHDWIDWIICGGETGPKARPMHPDWVRSLRDQCRVTGIPFFFKSWGEWLNSYDFGANLSKLYSKKKKLPLYFNFPDATGMNKVGKKLAGHLLDGVEYHQFPNRSRVASDK